MFQVLDWIYNNSVPFFIINFFYYYYYWWGGTKSLGTAATSGLLYKPQMIYEDNCGAIGGMKIGRGNRSTRRKPAPAPLCPPQILECLPTAEIGRHIYNKEHN
jgi:hypothetical protein